MAAHAARAAGSVALWMLTKAARRPLDSVALFGAAALSLFIVINAVVLQTRPHSVPLYKGPPLPLARPKTPEEHSRPPAPPAPHEADAPHASQQSATRRSDQIAAFIEMSSHVMAVQRALTDYGYGQIKPSGFIDGATIAAIEKFERAHNMPVTGKVSERLVSELATMIGHPLE